MGGEDGWGGARMVRGKCRQLYFNNNKISFKKMIGMGKKAACPYGIVVRIK